jgi:hypothetical protein
MKTLRMAVPAILLAAMVLVPFADKAFTVDDTVFLLEAEHVQEDPLHPTAFDIVWYETPERLSKMMASGPVMPYLLWPAVALGGVEWAAHAVEFVMLVVTVLATVALGRRIGLGEHEATVAGLLVVASPAVLVMATTAMPDVPALAFGVLAVERLVAWRQEGRWHQAVGATLGFLLALLARSHTVGLLGVGALLVWGGEGRGEGHPARDTLRGASLVPLLPLAIAPVLVWGVLRVTRDPALASGVTEAVQGWATLRWTPRNLTSFLIAWVLAMPFALPWCLLHWRRLWWIALALAPLFGLMGWLDDSSPRRLTAYIATLGAAALIDVLVEGWRRRDRVQVALGAWLLLGLPVVVYVNMAPKYLVPSAPAAALLLARMLTAPAPSRRMCPLLAVIGACGLLLGVLIACADAAFAGLGRRAAAELIAPAVAQGRTVWFVGHWGYQWYALHAGGRPLTRTPPVPAVGDLVVASARTHGGDMIKLVEHRRAVATLVEDAPGGRIMAAGAGFFSNHWGDLPWTWSREELDRFTVWQVEPE